MKDQLINWVKFYIQYGLKVLLVYGVSDGLCACGVRQCGEAGRHQIVGAEYTSSNTTTLISDLDRHPNCSIGIKLIDASRVVVLRVGHPKNTFFQNLSTRYSIPATLVNTNALADYYFFRLPADFPMDQFRSGNDFYFYRIGELIVVPPSIGLGSTYYTKVNSPISQLSSNQARELAELAELARPLPLRRKLPRSAEYPVESMGKILGSLVKELHQVVQAPLGVCAQSVLAAAALAVQGIADVEFDGRKYLLSCYFITVAESGERKSAIDKLVLLPHREKQKSDWKKYQVDLSAYNKAQKSSSTKSENMDSKPISPICMVDEPTYEALIKHLYWGQPSIGIFSDEGGRLVCGHGMNKENKIKTSAGYSSLWDRGEGTRMRVEETPMVLYGKRMSIHLLLQPLIARNLYSDQQMVDQGLLNRVLFSFPEPMAGKRPYTRVNIQEQPAFKVYSKFMTGILNKDLAFEEGSRNQLNPPTIGLTDNAIQIWIQFYHEVEQEIGDGGEYCLIKGFASKAAEHAIRLAGILQLFSDCESQNIDEENMKHGVSLTRYYLSEALRVFDVGNTPYEIVLAELLLEWLRDNNKTIFYTGEVIQRGPKKIRDAKTVKRILRLLVEHGFLSEVKDDLVIDGKKRKFVYRVLYLTAHT